MRESSAEFYNSIRGKWVCFIGAGVSHQKLIPLFAQSGAQVTLCDRRQRQEFPSGQLEEFEAAGVRFCLGADYLSALSDAQLIMRSPGISCYTPEIVRAKLDGAEVTSEMELFFRCCPCRIIGVTGSDGKTTTSSLIAAMLKKAGYNVLLGGNIGVPLFERVDGISPRDVVVAELSSFQLMSMEQSPDVAVVTNISPNHLDYHADLAEYIAAKRNIVAHGTRGSVAVLNYDDPRVMAFAPYCTGKIRYFSAEKAVDGAYVQRKAVWRDGKKLLALDELKLRGFHNAVNVATAAAAVEGLVTNEDAASAAREFTGVEHRLEFIREKNGVKYYNDSIATTPTRTVAGLSAFTEPVVLIAGGYDKKIPFEPLVDSVIKRVRLLVLTGTTAPLIEKAVTESKKYRGVPEIVRAENLEQAAALAADSARSGEVVLLSPACASFDSFKNFEQRGERFKELVNAL